MRISSVVVLLLSLPTLSWSVLDYDKQVTMIQAVSNDNKMLILEELAKGKDIDEEDGWFKNALQHAIVLEKPNMAMLLIEKGADVNRHGIINMILRMGNEDVLETALTNKNITQETKDIALIESVEIGNEKLINRFLANKNITQETKDSVLIKSVEMRNKKLINRLLDLGANINGYNYTESPLSKAMYGLEQAKDPKIIAEYYESIDFLESKGAKGTLRVFQIALSMDIELVKKYLPVVVDTGDIYKVRIGTRIDHSPEGLEIAKILLDNGVDVDAFRYIDEYDEETALMTASYWDGGIPFAQLLLDYGADINKQNYRGETAIYYAIYHKQKKMIDFLLKNGADIRIDNTWEPFILRMIVRKDIEFAEFLLERGANIDAQNKDGRSALHYAVSERQTDVVKFLLKNGANKNVSNNKGDTPLELAKKLTRKEIIKLLE